MPVNLLTVLLMMSMQAPVPAQVTPAQVPNPLGYTYRLPEDWEMVGAKPAEPEQQKKEEGKTAIVEEKKGIACVEVEMTARHGEPPTVVVIVGLPFECYGQTMTEQDLPGFGAGATDGLKEAFDLGNTLSVSYELAGHHMWAERASATVKGKTAPSYTLEITCTLLKKGAVCWMAQAADEPSLHVFESAPVTLDGETAPALVPRDTFVKTK